NHHVGYRVGPRFDKSTFLPSLPARGKEPIARQVQDRFLELLSHQLRPLPYRQFLHCANASSTVCAPSNKRLPYMGSYQSLSKLALTASKHSFSLRVSSAASACMRAALAMTRPSLMLSKYFRRSRFLSMPLRRSAI